MEKLLAKKAETYRKLNRARLNTCCGPRKNYNYTKIWLKKLSFSKIWLVIAKIFRDTVVEIVEAKDESSMVNKLLGLGNQQQLKLELKQTFEQ